MPDPWLRALVVDDELHARERVRTLLEAESDVLVVGECADGISALHSIRELSPHVVFLDVEMPELDGFEVLQQLDLSAQLHVVFVTAYDHYALRAFEVHAVDYLLKPFDRERFARCVRHLRERLTNGSWPQARAQLKQLLAEIEQERARASQLIVKTDGRLICVDPEDVDWIEAEGNYVRVHAGPQQHLVRMTMSALARQLDATRFARIHRSTIVNLRRIHELHPLFHGEYTVVLRNGARLTLSRSYRDALRQLLPGI
jgi:two-component system LytT family response regulator